MKKIVKGLLTYYEKIEKIDLKNREAIFLMLSVPPICNYKCKKCFNSASSKKIKDAMTLKEMYRVIKEGKENGIKNVFILGDGEPLVYRHIRKIVEYVDKMGLILTISTNGRMLSKEFANFLYKHNVVLIVSLDTLNEGEYDSYCGGNASLKVVLKNVDYARKLYAKKIYRKNGYKIYELIVHMTVTAQNFGELERIEKFCKDDIYFNCQTLSEVGDAKKNAAYFKGMGSEYKKFQKTSHLTKPPMVLLKMENGQHICCTFYYGLFVAYNGDVVLDAQVSESLRFIGNVRNHPLEYLIKRRNMLRDFYLQNYHRSGFCPIREKNIFKKFLNDLKKGKYKPKND